MVIRKSTLKFFSLALAVLSLFACFSLSVLAVDEAPEPEYSAVLELIEYLFGDAAVTDGQIDYEAIVHTLFYKDSPAITDMLNLLYDVLWGVVMFFINLFA